MQASNVSTLAFWPPPFSPSAAAPKQMPHKQVVWKVVHSDAAYPAAMTRWEQDMSCYPEYQPIAGVVISPTDFEGKIWKQGC